VNLIWNDKELLGRVGNAVEVATEEGAKIVAATAARLAPSKSGKLRMQIEAKPSRWKDGGWTVWAQGPGDYDRFYAIWVELGAPITRNVKAQPFLRPALRMEKQKIMKAFEGKLK